jgi:hypothetical protein
VGGKALKDPKTEIYHQLSTGEQGDVSRRLFVVGY